MGIKSLNPFLKEKCPEAFKDLPYSYFRGKRVAVDSDNVLRKLMSRAHKEVVNAPPHIPRPCAGFHIPVSILLRFFMEMTEGVYVTVSD